MSSAMGRRRSGTTQHPTSSTLPHLLLLLLLLLTSTTVLLVGGREAAREHHQEPAPQADIGDGYHSTGHDHHQLESSDRILRLPGQPTHPPISQFSGYITVNRKNGRALFYWFFEALSQPSQKPLLLWLNGGPGCSSVGYGAGAELGPLRVKPNGTGLEFNKFAWNNEANLLFVESPVGVGFSYTNTTSDLSRLDDGSVAEDAYNFIVNWMRRFPQYQKHDFYISGESYAGHYVPQLAEIVYDRSKDKKHHHPRINFKGFIVGNPETVDYYDTKGLVEYAWSHAVISDQLYHLVTNACDFTLPMWTDGCGGAMTELLREYKQIDIYNVYAPKCLSPAPTTSSTDLVPSTVRDDSHAEAAEETGTFRRMRMPGGGYDPCFSSYAEQYFNRDDVRGALHANVGHADDINNTARWKVCNDSILRTYNFTVASVLPIYSKLVKAGLRIWIYSGDADGRVPVIGTRYCVEALKLPLKTSWRSWFHEHQVAGRFVEYEGLTMVTVRGAGHLVPLNKPSESLRLISTFLSGERLPTTRF